MRIDFQNTIIYESFELTVDYLISFGRRFKIFGAKKPMDSIPKNLVLTLKTERF